MSQHHRQKTSHETPSFTSAVPSGEGTAKDIGGGQSAVEGIRLRAYELSQARNGEPGDELSDWIQAEQEAMTGRNPKR